MKKLLTILFLSAFIALAHHGNTPLYGNYDETGHYRSEPVLVIGREYEITNDGGEIISVVVMPGQNLSCVELGQTVRFTAQGDWLLIYSPYEAGNKLKAITLELLAL